MDAIQKLIADFPAAPYILFAAAGLLALYSNRVALLAKIPAIKLPGIVGAKYTPAGGFERYQWLRNCFTECGDTDAVKALDDKILPKLHEIGTPHEHKE